MDKKGTKIFRFTLVVFILFVAGGFVLNWYLTYKLEDSLRQKLREEVAKATEGFYDFSYDNLSVGLFSGELSIEGAELVPDSTVFNEWGKGDSLPDLYYRIRIGKIHFKGINLTWRWNYKNLDFSLFELQSPEIRIYRPQLYSELKSPLDKRHDKESKTLYQMISTYIDVLSVRKINLIDANIFYTIEDSISPVIYALSDANLNAYKFRLDKDSYSSGNLLYCDNFEFSAEKPQQLLYSDQLIVNTDNIYLSTMDEEVRIDGVHLHPTDDFWNKRTTKTGGYLDATIKSVLLNGVKFKRENTRNYLDADSFKISSTDIQYYIVQGQNKGDSISSSFPDTINTNEDLTWSLYDIVSPILQRISIAEIGIDKTRFNYTSTQNGQSDEYSMQQFDFHAKNFLIDSISEAQKKFWYVDNFVLSASQIKGHMITNNEVVEIDTLSLNTENKHFGIRGIKIKPIDISSATKNYLKGTIKSIQIEGLNYDTGVSADELLVEAPNISYYKVNTQSPKTKSSNDNIELSQDILDIFDPYADYLSVDKIKLDNGNIVLHDLSQQQIYRLKDLNFYALKFLINGDTRRAERYLFACEDIGLSLKDFDNPSPDGNYRLKVKNIDISTLSGHLLLEDVKLLPQTESWTNPPASYYKIDVPLVKVTGFDNKAYINNKKVNVKSLEIKTPEIAIVKLFNPSTNVGEGSSPIDFLSNVSRILVDSVNITKVKFSYIDRILSDSLQGQLESLGLHSLEWNIEKDFNLENLILQSPYIAYITKNKQGTNNKALNKNSFSDLLGNNIHVSRFALFNGKLSLNNHDTELNSELKKVDLSDIIWKRIAGKNFLSANSIHIDNPQLNIHTDYSSDSARLVRKKDPGKDLYLSLGNYFDQLSLGTLNMTNAQIDYDHSLNGLEQDKQAISKVNLFVDNLLIDTDKRKVDMAYLRFSTKDLHFPIMDGYYTLAIGSIDIDKKYGVLGLSGINMTSIYPKMDFAYRHPLHKDWFDVTTGDIILSGIDYPRFFSENILVADHLSVSDVVLKNLKNKKIYTPPKMQPLIYTKLYDLPFGISVDSTNISNFSVIYEELPKKGETLGEISFIGMNAILTGLTNRPIYSQQYMHLNAEGNLMGAGYFTAKWDMSVNPEYDCFVLSGKVYPFDLKHLNRVVTPLANAEIKSGMLRELTFRTEASGENAHVDMKFLYNDLTFTIFKGNKEEETNKFMTGLANMIVRSNNPNKPRQKPRESHLYIDRDPYHSTFNYFWQILQPPIVESVGVSQGKQTFMKKTSAFFTKVKNFFSRKKNDQKVDYQEVN